MLLGGRLRHTLKRELQRWDGGADEAGEHDLGHGLKDSLARHAFAHRQRNGPESVFLTSGYFFSVITC